VIDGLIAHTFKLFVFFFGRRARDERVGAVCYCIEEKLVKRAYP